VLICAGPGQSAFFWWERGIMGQFSIFPVGLAGLMRRTAGIDGEVVRFAEQENLQKRSGRPGSKSEQGDSDLRAGTDLNGLAAIPAVGSITIAIPGCSFPESADRARTGAKAPGEQGWLHSSGICDDACDGPCCRSVGGTYCVSARAGRGYSPRNADRKLEASRRVSRRGGDSDAGRANGEGPYRFNPKHGIETMGTRTVWKSDDHLRRK